MYRSKCDKISRRLYVGDDHLRPNPISLETALKLAEKLKVPVEQIMHMPPHILVQKMAEAEAKDAEDKK